MTCWRPQWTEFYYKPALEQSEAESAALLRRVNEGSQSVAKLVSDLQQADLRAKHIEVVAEATCQGVRAEEGPRVKLESAALLHYSQSHRRDMASQRQGAETMHCGIMQRERAEFDELLRREKEQVRVIREEAADLGNHCSRS